MKKILLLFFTFCFCSFAKAQNTFEKIIDTLGSAGALCIQETFDGGYVYCGTSMYNGNDAMIVKLDSIGTIEWAKVYSGPGMEGGAYIEQTPDSGYIVNAAYDVGLYTKSWLLRLDSNGDTLWTKTFSVGTGATHVASGNSMATVNNTLYGLTGYVSPQPILSAYLIVCLNNGSLLASKIYDTPFGSTGYAVSKSFDNNGFAITGEYAVGSTSSDVNLVRTDVIGDTLWTRHYSNSPNDVGFDLKQTADSGFIIAGFTWNSSTLQYNIYLIKTDSAGDTLWTKQYGDTVSCGARSVQQTTDDGYIILARIVNGTPLNSDFYLLKTDANGDTLWSREFGGSSADEGYFVRQTKDGGYIMCGGTSSFGNGGTYIIKTDSLGNMLTGLGAAEVNNPFGFSVFPNPASGIFTVRLKGLPLGKSNLEIYNLNNQCIHSSTVKNNATEQVDLSKMPDGMYVILLRMKEKIISKKIIIQK